MHPRIGLSTEELVETFNEMYLRSWGEVSEKLRWDLAKLHQDGAKERDMAPFLLELMEAVVNACRDSTVMTIYENNERLAQDLEEDEEDFV